MRRKTRNVMVGNVGIGADFPISIQSMTNIPVEQVDANVAQITKLVINGCEIIRIAVPKPSDVFFLDKIKRRLIDSGVEVPLVADVHFSPRVAYDCLKIADKVRINAGNFAGKNTNFVAAKTIFSRFFESAKQAGIPVRIGVNAGSLSARMVEQFGNTARGMWKSAYECIIPARKVGFENLVLSFKASDVNLMVAANRLACTEMERLGMDYPLHLGVTEAGNSQYARIKSAIGIGGLLVDGIGDTVRVSLTEDPQNEIPIARDILQASGVRSFGPEFIACPSCGRTSYDIQTVFEEVKKTLFNCKKCLKIAVMGCIVNGLGEAAGADYAIVGMPSGTLAIYKKNTCLAANIDPQDVPFKLQELVMSDQSGQHRC